MKLLVVVVAVFAVASAIDAIRADGDFTRDELLAVCNKCFEQEKVEPEIQEAILNGKFVEGYGCFYRCWGINTGIWDDKYGFDIERATKVLEIKGYYVNPEGWKKCFSLEQRRHEDPCKWIESILRCMFENGFIKVRQDDSEDITRDQLLEVCNKCFEQEKVEPEIQEAILNGKFVEGYGCFYRCWGINTGIWDDKYGFDIERATKVLEIKGYYVNPEGWKKCFSLEQRRHEDPCKWIESILRCMFENGFIKVRQDDSEDITRDQLLEVCNKCFEQEKVEPEIQEAILNGKFVEGYGCFYRCWGINTGIWDDKYGFDIERATKVLEIKGYDVNHEGWKKCFSLGMKRPADPCKWIESILRCMFENGFIKVH